VQYHDINGLAKILSEARALQQNTSFP